MVHRYAAVATAYVPTGSSQFNIAASEHRSFHMQPFVVDGRAFDRRITMDQLRDGRSSVTEVPCSSTAGDDDEMALALTHFLLDEEEAVVSAFARSGWTVVGDWCVSDLSTVVIDDDTDDPMPVSDSPDDGSEARRAVFECTVAITWESYSEAAFDPVATERVIRSGLGADCPAQPDIVVRAIGRGRVAEPDIPWFALQGFAGYCDVVSRYWSGDAVTAPHDEESGGHPLGSLYLSLSAVAPALATALARASDAGFAITGLLLHESDGAGTLSVGVCGWATRHVARMLRTSSSARQHVDNGQPNALLIHSGNLPPWVPEPVSDRSLFYGEQQEFGAAAVMSRESAERVRVFTRVLGEETVGDALLRLVGEVAQG